MIALVTSYPRRFSVYLMFNIGKIILKPKVVFIPLVISVFGLVGAYLVSLLPDIGINSFVGKPAVFFSSNLERLTSILPIGFAFAAGMVSAVNPCGFVMLPAYLGLYIGATSFQGNNVKIHKLVTRSIFISCSVSLGFLVLFAIVGFLISIGSRSVISVFPWFGFSIGVMLVLLGAWLFTGKGIYLTGLGKSATKIGNPNNIGFQGFFLFGISYGIVSLSCTLPIFLLVVGTTFASKGIINAGAQFISFALGMGFIITVLTISVAFVNTTIVNFFIKIGQYINFVVAGLVMIAGVYIVFYWLTIGGL